jgi:hypothetical protein
LARNRQGDYNLLVGRIFVDIFINCAASAGFSPRTVRLPDGFDLAKARWLTPAADKDNTGEMIFSVKANC